MKRHIYFITLLSLVFCSACKKFLDERQDRSLSVPSTLQDVQLILDRNNILNTDHPYLSEGSADDYYLTDADFAALSGDHFRANYVWGEELIFSNYPNDWAQLYSSSYLTQLSLETLDKVQRSSSNALEYDDVKGQALFHRARTYHLLALIWALQYDDAAAASLLGVPLRLTTDFNQLSVRSNMQQTYKQIESDLLASIPLLPVNSIHPMRPSRISAYALAARLYLSMRDYPKAGLYADSAWQLKNDLLDYNSISNAPTYPFAAFNKEVLFVSSMANPSHLATSRCFIDTNLIASYAANDLRRTLYFKDNGSKKLSWRGSYNGSASLFTGIATDEVLLTRAESFARAGNTTAAMNDLNALLIKRYKTGTFTPLKAASAQEALSLILTERRKELLMRDIRWMDLKRFNKESAFAVTIRRKVNGQIIELPPNSPRYALPIPAVVIAQTGMQQNER